MTYPTEEPELTCEVVYPDCGMCPFCPCEKEGASTK